ncbi:5'-nucleotidase C-terminal domain-containing protein [Candidatus Thioglobus sp.]|nr:5'-nucleotidase C-terminal domain-containing protein [Candidatus Thioglobus sp.]MDB3893858.1 5'-nucleotidase C-terminal domain-containing protein [Candidatus Thioglobus sp.]MDB9829027.1 5'-nucleotidase C-terminal domain-containing protein [Candidatus Thioglobus sp.]MDC0965772.1 5'-nucleotidase C-terminal domain-containing protein [Candidatus Thioglobus sp.]MDC3266061.1 5'-nucleotidase C-terminal domain-containing protein [Candidatus Thioglobus sp.]
MSLTRRDFIKVLGAGSAAGLISGCGNDAPAKLASQDNMYEVAKTGNARILHITDTHGNLLPNYFREPNVNLGFGPTYGQLPHVVGNKLLEQIGVKPGSAEAYAFTYNNFEELSAKYGKTGGFGQIKTVLDSLRDSAGGVKNTLTIDGGDTWQGSGTSLWTRGADMVEACNMLGVDVMVGHWEFTYKEEETLKNIGFFKGDFLGQNVRILEDALMGDKYATMTEKFDGNGLYSEDDAMPFKPYVIKNVGGHRIAVIGQAFPRTSNANPQKYFFPDWSFGLREDEMSELVADIRENEKPDAVIVVSHNGMDVDIKMASRVVGIDAIFGGHTHDGMPKPIEVKNAGGITVVTNAGCSGKYIGVMDLEIKDHKMVGYNYKMLPILTNFIKPDAAMVSYITKMRNTKYDKNVVEARSSTMSNNPDRVGKTYDEILTEKLCSTNQTLYRRGNFMGTWDQVLVNSLREEHDADFAMSAGVRWGTSVPAGHDVTMEDLMTNTSMTYGETYVSEMKGAQLKEVLEGIAENLFVQDPYLQSGGDMVRMGGMDYTIDPAAGLGNRISEMKDDEGTLIDPNKSYKVSGWAQVGSVGNGRLMWDVAADYLRKQGTLDLKKVNHPTIKGVKTNPGIENYSGKLV